jgi:hypothetical protein
LRYINAVFEFSLLVCSCSEGVRARGAGRSAFEDLAMAETTRLSVGKALDKLRSPDAPKSKIARLDEKIDALVEETERMRAQRLRLERHQRAAKTKRD